MRRAISCRPQGHWPVEATVARVTLAFQDRHKRRIRLHDDLDAPFLLDLPAATLLVDGDGLELEDGGYIAVRAAAEPVVDITGRDPAHAARLAWHIGNRHAPVQVLGDGRLRIAEDHVLVAMLEGLGARVDRLKAPFAPEPGAYAGGPSHAH